MKLGVISSENSEASYVHAVELPMRMENNDVELRFSWSNDGVEWNEVDHVTEATMLNEWVSPHSSFTGTFRSSCCQDLSDRSAWAA